ncbi:MAG: hypothetical protein JWM99_4814 [Verrucomicrobiales bacterium]|nr:hypothetical protein [Verrucomicrobiales bacterium]
MGIKNPCVTQSPPNVFPFIEEPRDSGSKPGCIGVLFSRMKCLTFLRQLFQIQQHRNDRSFRLINKCQQIFADNGGLLLFGIILLATSCKERSSNEVKGVTSYDVQGVVQEVRPAEKSLVIQHREIPGYMSAMTMLFPVRHTNLLMGLAPGSEINFLLKVTPTEGWIDRITVTGMKAAEGKFTQLRAAPSGTNSAIKLDLIHALTSYKFTNEFGRPVLFSNYRGQALGLTFFFTSCPFPEFCPRLMRNFADASQILEKNPNSATNWHLFALTIDPEIDTPTVLKEYGKTYGYASNHWSFLTTDIQTLGEITRNFGFQMTREGKVINHSFYTAVINPEGDLRTFWRIGGNTSADLASQILEATRSQIH